MVLFGLCQYIDVNCVSSSLEDVGRDSRVQQVMESVMLHSIHKNLCGKAAEVSIQWAK